MTYEVNNQLIIISTKVGKNKEAQRKLELCDSVTLTKHIYSTVTIIKCPFAHWHIGLPSVISP